MDVICIFEGSFIEVSIAKDILDDEGIACFMQSEHGEAFLLKTGGTAFERYQLYVNPEQAEEARQICQAFLEGDGGI